MSTQPRSPGRPRKFETAEIIDQAVDLFWRQGYKASTTRDMQDALGLSQSSIYNAFGSKQQLLDAALQRYEEQTTNALLAPLHASTDGLQAIDRFFAALQQWISKDGRHGCMMTNLMNEDGGATPMIVDRARAYREGVREEFACVLQRAKDSGEIAATTNIDARSQLLVNLVLGVNVSARATESRELGPIIAAIRSEIQAWAIH